MRLGAKGTRMRILLFGIGIKVGSGELPGAFVELA